MKKTQALRFTDSYTAKAIEAEKTDCIEIHNKQLEPVIENIK